MKIRIDANPSGPLRVLGELPDSRLAVLEGLNGIGKTLAVRVLQICTGERPYPIGSPSWVSLCEGLGDFSVRISDLKGAETIEWRADSRTWIGKEDPQEFDFKSISIDSRPATLSDVRQTLVVHRLAGDETLVETLAQQADRAAAAVKRWNDEILANDGSGALARLEDLASDLMLSLGEWSLDAHADLRSSAVAAKERVQKAERDLAAASQQLEKLKAAASVQRRRDRLQRIGPELRNQIEAVDAQIEEKNNELRELQKRILDVAQSAAKTEPALQELKNAQRTLERNQTKLSQALNDAAAVAAELEIEPETDACLIAVRDVEERIDSLTAQRRSMDAAPAMRELLDKVSGDLEQAEVHGLGDQIALDDPETDLQMTVHATRLGIVTRRDQLEGQPPPPAARKIAEKLSAAEARRKQLARLESDLADVARFRRLSKKNEKRVENAMAEAEPEALAELRSLEERQREVNQSVMHLAAKRAAARQLLSGLGDESEELLTKRLVKALTQLGIPADQIESETADAEAREQRAALELAQARKEHTALRRELARAEAEIARINKKLAPTGELSWLARGLPLAVDEHPTDPEGQLAFISRVRGRLAHVVERLGAHRTQLGAVERALRGLGRHLRGHDAQTAEYVPELEEWFGSSFSRWFTTEEIRSALLPEAESDIVVDVREREVKWKINATARSKPLDAFSSGEQAFAYTRAQLEVLDHESSQALNRLIVLDEFGAFIAHDRLLHLLGYLKDRVEEHPDDQVLVILPVSHDYGEESRSAIGPQKQALEQLAEEVAERGFAVQELVK